MEKISIQEIVTALMKKSGLRESDAGHFVAAMFDVVQEGLERDSLVKVKGLGTFKIIDVEARESVNVNTGERIVIEGRGKITFTPDSTMKEMVNKPFSQFETVVLNDGVEFDDMTDSESASAMPLTTEDTTKPTEDATQPTETATQEPELVSQPTEEVVQPMEDAVLPTEETAENAVEETVETIIEKATETEPVEEKSVIDEPVADVPVVESLAAVVNEDANDDDEGTVVPMIENAEAEDTEEEHGADEEGSAGTANLQDEPEEETDEEPFEEGEDGKRKWWLWILILLAAVAVCAGIGYYLAGRANQPEQKETEKPKPAAVAADTVAQPVDSVKAAVQKPDSIVPAKPSQANVGENADARVLDEYEKKDARVRVGAYRIIGLERVVKVKKGQTLKRISFINMGPGMDCYVEAYNDLKATDVLEEGQEIKIPKIELKKKKNKNKAGQPAASPQP